MITLGSLFDGIGGWQIAAKRAGIHQIWSSEIEKFPCALTKERFSDTKQLGDITEIDGGEIPPVDIVTMGSPCQDLSIAGRREGLEGKRSGLFIRAVELIREMRRATNGEYPKIAVWENVTGAFTSNKGMDFKTVLETLTETSIPMPRYGKWANAVMVRSGKCNIVWRVLDAQFWGVPQRRRRIFLVVDYTKGCTEEILFKPKSVCGDIATSQEVRREAGTQADAGIERTSTFDMTHASDVIRESHGSVNTLQARMGTGGNQVPLVYQKIIGTLQARDYKGIGNQDVKEGRIVINKNPMCLRRLTPLECERLQGLPDNWTLINDKSCSDSARYKAIGNGMAQPCADFVIKRVARFLRKG